MQLGQLQAALDDLNQAVTKQSDPKHHHLALVRRAQVKDKMGHLHSATADLDAAHAVQPLSHGHQLMRQHCSKDLAIIIEQSRAAERYQGDFDK